MASQPSRPRLDRAALAMILTPVLILAGLAITTTVRVVTGGAGEMGPLEWFVFVLFAAIAVLLSIAAFVHLRPAFTLRLTDSGISTGGPALAWARVERVEIPGFGRVVVHGAGRRVVVPTYLFVGRADLEARIRDGATNG